MARRKEEREEPLGTISYQTGSERSPPFWLLISARKTQVFWHQSEARTAATFWNWSGETLSPGALVAVLYFSSCHIFSRPFRILLVPTICPWVSEDGVTRERGRAESTRVYWANNRVFSHDVMAAILVSQNNKTAAMLESQTNPVGVKLFSYANAFFCSNKFA